MFIERYFLFYDVGTGCCVGFNGVFSKLKSTRSNLLKVYLPLCIILSSVYLLHLYARVCMSVLFYAAFIGELTYSYSLILLYKPRLFLRRAVKIADWLFLAD